jgi:hypothetical protein
MRRVSFLIVVLATALLAGGTGRMEAASYGSSDVLLVAYQPHGREFIVNLGPGSGYVGATGPVDVTQYTASDIAGVYGGTLPTNLNLAVIAANGADGYLATNGPADTTLVGSAIGASQQIQFLGANFKGLSAPVSGNANAGTFEFGDPRSYQATLNRINAGSLGNNVSFDAENPLPTHSILVPFFQARRNPFAGIPATQTLLGSFQMNADGTLRYLPKRDIQAVCVAGPKTLNPKAQGATFSMSVTLTDATDPANPLPVDLSRMDPAFLSQVGSTTLPTPFAGPGCGPSDDGIWETLSSRTPTGVNFVAPSDGNCSTLDGNRQDIYAALGRDIGSQPICLSSSVEGNSFTCCDTVTVLDKTRR